MFRALPMVVILPLSYGLGIWTGRRGSHRLLLLPHVWYLHAAVSRNQQTYLGVKLELPTSGMPVTRWISALFIWTRAVP